MEQVQAVVDLVLSIIAGLMLMCSMGLLIFMTIKAHKADKEHEKVMKELEKEYTENIKRIQMYLQERANEKTEKEIKKRTRKTKKVEE